MSSIEKGFGLGYPKCFTNIRTVAKNLISINFALKDPLDALAWYEW